VAIIETHFLCGIDKKTIPLLLQTFFPQVINYTMELLKYINCFKSQMATAKKTICFPVFIMHDE